MAGDKRDWRSNGLAVNSMAIKVLARKRTGDEQVGDENVVAIKTMFCSTTSSPLSKAMWTVCCEYSRSGKTHHYWYIIAPP